MADFYSDTAEKAVLAAILREGKESAGSIIGVELKADDFHVPGHRVLAEVIWDAYNSTDPIDPVSIGGKAAAPLSQVIGQPEPECIKLVARLAKHKAPGNLESHVHEVQYQAQRRRLHEMLGEALERVQGNTATPDEIAGSLSEGAVEVLTDRLAHSGGKSFGDLGRGLIAKQRQRQEIVQQGYELGATFGLPFIDDYTKGIQPGELWMFAGDPNVGKTSIAYMCAFGFAAKQAVRAPEEQVGTLVLSLEMDEWQTATRFASQLAGIDGAKIRSGHTTDGDLKRIAESWALRKDLPLWFEFPSMVTTTQMRAIIAEYVRRHNVGFIVVDHFSYFTPDRWIENDRQRDAEKVKFLKQMVAKDMQLAVCCLNHTNKGRQRMDDPRPTMEDSKGAREVQMLPDLISIMWSPWEAATDTERAAQDMDPLEYEMNWVKSRGTRKARARFRFDPATMTAK